MRSDSRFLANGETSILKQEVRTPTVEAGLAGKSGVEEIEDYRGIWVLSAFMPIEFQGVKWVVVGEIDSDEVFAAASRTRNVIAIVGAVALVLSVFIGFLGVRGVTRPAGAADGYHARHGRRQVRHPGFGDRAHGRTWRRWPARPTSSAAS